MCKVNQNVIFFVAPFLKNVIEIMSQTKELEHWWRKNEYILFLTPPTFYWIVYQHKQSRRTKLLKLQIMQKQSSMIHNSTTSFWRWFFPAIPPVNFATARTRPTRRSIGDSSVEICTPPYLVLTSLLMKQERWWLLMSGISTWSVVLQNPVRADFQPFIADTRNLSKSVIFSHPLAS